MVTTMVYLPWYNHDCTMVSQPWLSSLYMVQSWLYHGSQTIVGIIMKLLYWWVVTTMVQPWLYHGKSAMVVIIVHGTIMIIPW